MNNIFKYKNFVGSIGFSIEDMILRGKIECINDLVTYEAKDLPSLKAAFEEAVDDYIETCAAIGKEPEKTMSGTFNVRIGPDLHKKAFVHALKLGLGLNDYIRKATEEKLNSKNEYHFHFDRRPEKVSEKLDFERPSRSLRTWDVAVEKRTNH